jgi:hypothetical protein
MSKDICPDWTPEPKFSEKVKEKIGYGSVSTLQRWRRINKIPRGFEWRYFGRVPMWREKAETAT